MTYCPRCTSKDIATRSIRKTSTGIPRQRYQCNSCKTYFTGAFQETITKIIESSTKRFVITSCQNNATVHREFLENLSNYCNYMNAELLIVPIVYRPDDHEVLTYDIPESIPHTIVNRKLKIHSEIYVMGSFNFIPTAVNPLSGLESLSKGDTLIVPSPQLRMKSLAVSATRHPAILHTTGAISHPEYTNTKVGEKAKFNHSYSAVLVEIDSDNDFHVRALSADDSGMFYDLGLKFTPGEDVPVFESVVALVTGDEHALCSDETVERATYLNKDSISRVLKPEYVVRHDVLDAYSISHHHKRDSIKSVGKYLYGMNTIQDELNVTVDYVKRTTVGQSFTNIMVPSNHHDHLTRWLSEVNIKDEPWNALIYHKMMYSVLESLKKTESGVSHVDPLEMFFKWENVQKTKFLKYNEGFNIAGVEMGYHGHSGSNGARGSIGQYSNLSDKYIIGHSHTPGIVAGAYQVGTSSKLKLEYNNGPSSWAHVHCIVYSNGKRQLIRIVNGKWKA